MALSIYYARKKEEETLENKTKNNGTLYNDKKKKKKNRKKGIWSDDKKVKNDTFCCIWRKFHRQPSSSGVIFLCTISIGLNLKMEIISNMRRDSSSSTLDLYASIKCTSHSNSILGMSSLNRAVSSLNFIELSYYHPLDLELSNVGLYIEKWKKKSCYLYSISTLFLRLFTISWIFAISMLY